MGGVFFDEEDHVVSKEFIIKLTEEIFKNKLDYLKYDAMCGYINMDKEMLRAMKKAGYYKLRIGIETASDSVAKLALGKRINIDKLMEILAYAKEIGIKMYGTFTFGAIGSEREEDLKTLKLIQELLDKDLLSEFQRSINTPLPGTPFYKWAEENNLLLSRNWDDYDGGTVVVNLPGYKKEDLEEIYRRCGEIFLKYQLRKNKWSLFKQEVKKRGFLAALNRSFYTIKGLLSVQK